MSDTQQNATNTLLPTDESVVPTPFSQLSPIQQDWVDFTALQGVITESDGTQHKMTIQQFADANHVDRTTCYRWQKTIPNFWDLVHERQKTMNTGARLSKVWNALYLAATVKLNVQAMQTYLSNNDPSFRMPQHQIKHDVGGGLADLLERARTRTNPEQIIEGEIVDDPDQTADA